MVDVDRTVSWELMLIALVMTAAIMAGLFAVGDMLSDEKVSGLAQDIEAFNVEQDAQEMSRRLAANLPERNCEALNIAVNQTSEDVRTLQETVARYEDSAKIPKAEFTLLKKRYMNLLLERWLTVRQVDEECPANYTTVLYIYRDDSVCPTCADQGLVLTELLQRRDGLIVFPLDADLGMRPIDLLIDSYDIDTQPAMIIEGEAYEGFRTMDELEDILDGENGGT